LLDVAERNIKIITELDPQKMGEVYRMEALNPDSPDECPKVLRELVQKFIDESGISQPKIYVLDDPGLLIKVKNQKH
jgi:hypothetical protein